MPRPSGYLIISWRDFYDRLLGVLEGPNITMDDIVACPLYGPNCIWNVIACVDMNGEISLSDKVKPQHAELVAYVQGLFK